jgi:hypothetical protein
MPSGMPHRNTVHTRLQPLSMQASAAKAVTLLNLAAPLSDALIRIVLLKISLFPLTDFPLTFCYLPQYGAL